MPAVFCATCNEPKQFRRGVPDACPDCNKPFRQAAAPKMTRCGFCRRGIPEIEAMTSAGRTVCRDCHGRAN